MMHGRFWNQSNSLHPIKENFLTHHPIPMWEGHNRRKAKNHISRTSGKKKFPKFIPFQSNIEKNLMEWALLVIFWTINITNVSRLTTSEAKKKSEPNLSRLQQTNHIQWKDPKDFGTLLNHFYCAHYN